MLAARMPERRPKVHYPESDGKPMADYTVQYDTMVMLVGGIDTLIPDFVAGNLFWYPVEGEPAVVTAPDAMVAIGRPKGHRRSYLQWEEDGVAPQVVFEILSPSNTLPEMTRKFLFYQRYGVEEYYVIDPEKKVWFGYHRVGEELVEIQEMEGWVSPRLGVVFGYHEGEIAAFGPDGRRFRTFLEIAHDEAIAEAAAATARQEAATARQEAVSAHQEAVSARQEAESARQEAESARQEAESARQEADQQRARAEALAERLRALGLDPG